MEWVSLGLWVGQFSTLFELFWVGGEMVSLLSTLSFSIFQIEISMLGKVKKNLFPSPIFYSKLGESIIASNNKGQKKE